MIRNIMQVAFLVSLFILFAAPPSFADDPNWKENQQEMFDQMGLNSGDVINTDNWQKVKGLIPEPMVMWVKEGKMIMNIGEFKFDGSDDAPWENYGLKHNIDKYTIDEEGNLIETATGKPPKWVYGYPFPQIDFENDPDAGIKLTNNRDINMGRDGSFKAPFSTEWIGKKGFERALSCELYRYNFWGTKTTEQFKNSDGLLFKEITLVQAPYDMAGTAQLTIRKTDGSEDQLYVYIPAIRRTKRMSGANRSDPYLGSDFTVDDGNGWLGHTSSMEWKYIEERIGLMCIAKGCTERATSMSKEADGRWLSGESVADIQTGWQVKGSTQAPWSLVSAIWVPRKFYVVEAIPKDPYYNMGRMVFWVEKKILWSQYKLMWDIAGEYWKTGIMTFQFMKWKNQTTHAGNIQLCYDKKTDHATVLRAARENILGQGKPFEFDISNNLKQFSVSRLGTLTK